MIASVADLVAFLKRFHRHWLDDPTLDLTLIPADLPPPLATVYRELGALVEINQGAENDWQCPFHTQDSLTPLSRLKRVGGMIEFAWENQGNWSARCSAGEPDPPVYSNARDVWETPRRGVVVVCDSLAHFLTTLCLQEAVMGSRNLASVRTDGGTGSVVAADLRPLWVRGRYVFGEPSHNFFVSPDQDVLVMEYAGVWVGSNDRPVGSLVRPGVDALQVHGG
jgi:hypothetical protein